MPEGWIEEENDDLLFIFKIEDFPFLYEGIEVELTKENDEIHLKIL